MNVQNKDVDAHLVAYEIVAIELFFTRPPSNVYWTAQNQERQFAAHEIAGTNSGTGSNC